MSHVKNYIKKSMQSDQGLFFCSLNKIIYSLKRLFQKTILKDLNDLTLSFLAASHLYLHCLLKLVCD